MRKRGADYFKAWEKQLNELGSEELRRRAAERRAELLTAFERISEAFEALDEAYEPFMADLTDIETFLATDLTPQSISMIADVIKEANGEAAVVNKHIDAVVRQIDDTVGRFSA
jgi:hypothetical protein